MKSVTILTALIVQFGSIGVSAQLKKSEILEINTTFNAGSVTLLDGSKRVGEINFNDNDGIVALRNDDEVNYYNPKTIAGFDYKDATTNRKRIFFAMEFADTRRNDMKQFSFFEVLKEFKSFAVVAKIDPITADVQRPMGIPTNKAMSSKNNNKMVATQVETIYFMSEDGTIEPYIEIFEKETEKKLIDYNRTRYRFLDEDVFKRYTGSFYDELVEYAKSNQLTFKEKSHLINLLDHYEYLLSK